MGEFHSLVDSGCVLDPRVVVVHGITPETLDGNPGPAEVFPMFREFMGDAALIAHNARFDMGFLRAEFRRLGLRLTNRVRCTMLLSRRFHPRLPDHRLDTVYRHLCGEVGEATRRHRALDDARLTVEVWLAMEER